MTNYRKLLRDTRGVAAVETAFALPVLLVFIYGIFQVGIIYMANAGMQNALGEGARFATIFPMPSNADIKTRISSSAFGVGVGTFSTPEVTDGAGFKDLRVTFSMTPNFLFFTTPTITLTQKKRVYTAG